MLFIAIFILKIQHSIYNVGSKGMRPSWEIGPFAKTFNEHCPASLGPRFKFSNKRNFQF